MRFCGTLNKSTHDESQTSLEHQYQSRVDLPLHPETTNMKLVARWREENPRRDSNTTPGDGPANGEIGEENERKEGSRQIAGRPAFTFRDVCFSLLIMPRKNQLVNGNRRKIAPSGRIYGYFFLEIAKPFQILRASVQAPLKNSPLSPWERAGVRAERLSAKNRKSGDAEKWLVPRLCPGIPARRDRRGSASNIGQLGDELVYGRRSLPHTAFPARARERGCVDTPGVKTMSSVRVRRARS
jgi:hypothetical protein